MSIEGATLLKNYRLIDLRKKARMTQRVVAESVGVTQGMVAHIEAGKRQPSWNVRLRLAQLFDVSLEWLFASDEYKMSCADTGLDQPQGSDNV